MKTSRLLSLLFIILSLSACHSKKEKSKESDTGIPELLVQNDLHNFGDLEAGEVVSCSFKITNKGSGSLVIDSVAYGCACIQTEWPSKALQQGETAFVNVKYDSAGEWGRMYNALVIYSNSIEKKKIVYIAANVNNQIFNQE